MIASLDERSGYGIAAALAISLACTAIPARADDTNAILKDMTNYVASQKNILLTFDSSIEVVTPAVEKIQFASSGEVLLSRPDKLRAKRTGGYADVELVYDGKTATLYGKNLSDSRGITNYIGSGTPGFNGMATVIQPRTIGLTLGVKF